MPRRPNVAGPPVRRLSAIAGALLSTVGLMGLPGVHAQEPGSARPAADAPSASSSGHQRMLEMLRDIAARTPDTNPFLGDRQARERRDELAALPSDASDFARVEVLAGLGDEELRLGHVVVAIDRLQQAHALAAASPNLPVLAQYEILYRLGIAYLRLSETQNCVRDRQPGRCVVPGDANGVFAEREASRQAVQAFHQVLRANVEGTWRFREAQWLLNVAYMTLGEYPAGVPPEYRISPEAFSTSETAGGWIDRAPALGLDTLGLSGGAIVDDFTGDDYLDIVASNSDASGQMQFFVNGGDGTFSNRTRQAGLEGLLGGLNIVQADYDNDGHLDILVLRGAWLRDQGRHPNSLLRNNGDGTFIDVTFEAGLGRVHYPSHSGAWADYDLDGDLDLYIGNESSEELHAPSQLFRNEGDGTFVDVAGPAGVQNEAFAKGVTWGDFDNDRFPDLYVSNYRGQNRLYRNNGDGTFTDVAESLGVAGPVGSFPTWFWDVDNDGILDLYVAVLTAQIRDLAANLAGEPFAAELGRLYRGTGSGFVDVTQEFNLGHPGSVMGSNFGDFDNDGYLDMYLGTGSPPLEELQPNLLYRNLRGGTFANLTYGSGLGHLQKGHGVAFADLDNDGDQDIFQVTGGAVPADQAHDVLYENPGFGSHWITVVLQGVESNRSAIGARIRVEVTGDGSPRAIYRHVNSGGSFGANPLRQTIGLGHASRIESLEVFWPATGLTQTFGDVPLDRAIRIVEGADAVVPLDLDRLRLGPS